jgi:hypothetical protein
VPWIRGDDVPVMGRIAAVRRRGGVASNYDCCTGCHCPYEYVSGSLYTTPSSTTISALQQAGRSIVTVTGTQGISPPIPLTGLRLTPR